MGNLYDFILQPALHEIIALQSKTIQVLELFQSEILPDESDSDDDDVASNQWTGLNILLEDRSFSHLKEIRLLFGDFITNRESGFEETVSLYKSYHLKASEKGVRVTYGLKNGQDGLLYSNH